MISTSKSPDRKTENGVAAQLPEPSEHERKAIAVATTSRAKRLPRVAVSLTKTGPQSAQSGPNHADAKGWCARILDALGTTSADFLTTELGRIMNAVGSTGEDGEAKVNAVLAVLDGIKPKNEIEAMLASQIAVTHALAMELMGRTKRATDPGLFESSGNMAIKLMRTYALQMEVLATMRRGGKQTMQVKHVHVYPGGQAVVGNVTSRPRLGGRGSIENERQPHATSDSRAHTLAPGLPVRSPDTERDAVPLASNGQGTLPDARRRRG